MSVLTPNDDSIAPVVLFSFEARYFLALTIAVSVLDTPAVQSAAIGEPERECDLGDADARLREHPAGQTAARLVDDLVVRRALLAQPALQRPRAEAELLGRGFERELVCEPRADEQLAQRSGDGRAVRPVGKRLDGEALEALHRSAESGQEVRL